MSIPWIIALSIEADGALALAAGEAARSTASWSVAPRPVFGTRGAGQSAQTLTQPWRVSGKVKASGQSALMENVEFQYGSDEQGFKLVASPLSGSEHSRTSKACCPAVRLISIAPSPTPMPCANRPPPPFASLPNWGRPLFEPHC
mgnify:CR=1 FL=1